MLGKRPLASRVSPKKTWEGLVVGIIFGLLFAVIITFTSTFPVSLRFHWCLISLVMVIVSVLGDLSISVLKRISGVKDSGQLIPGHGGILDRLDSLLPTFLIAAIALILWVP